MSFPAYPEYEDSGVLWLGDVPAHWRVAKLKHLVDPTRPITYGIVQAGPDTPDGVPYIRPADMSDENGVICEEDVLRTSPDIATAYSRSMIRQGDLVCTIGPSFGKVMVTPTWLEGGNLTQGTARVAVSSECASRYVFWLLRSANSFAQWESSVGGATFRALNLGPLAETITPLPPIREQFAIAAFLDRETAKIDTLMAEQEKLIALLKEKRQAGISNAVTKGLDPDVPMKDSGIEWLGEVPATWDVWKLAHAFAKIGSGTTPPSAEHHWYEDGMIPWVTTGELRETVINETAKCVTPAALDQFTSLRLHPAGALVIAMYGATIGRLGILGVEATTNQACCVLGTPIHLDIKFTFYWLQGFKQIIVDLFSSGGGQPNINQDVVSSLRIPAPELAKQQLIASYLDRETAKLDELTAEANKAIGLLKERRSALISAAVTGKIDVRSMVSQPAQGLQELAWVPA